MASSQVTNEQIDQKLNLILEHLKFHEKRFDGIDRQLQEVRGDVKEMQGKIETLENTRLTWNAGLIAGILAANAIISLIIFRLLSTLGSKIAEIPFFVV